MLWEPYLNFPQQPDEQELFFSLHSGKEGRMKSRIFRDQVAIVTGASSGISRALALQLAGQGAKVILAARRVDLLEQAAAECNRVGGNALAVPTEINDESLFPVLVRPAISPLLSQVHA
jgi:NAD(P)-dependent dehydrogenase (short-subunit alcohol dehydrogenase family)